MDLLSPKAAAQYLHLQPHTLAVWRCNRQHLPFIKLGSRILYRRSDLDAYLDACTVITY
jgi:excisionase family DNA binding protein